MIVGPCFHTAGYVYRHINIRPIRIIVCILVRVVIVGVGIGIIVVFIVGVWIWAMLHAVRIAGKPLVLYEGAENQVLAILIWNMWDEGNIEGVGAIGALMILGLLIITLGLRMMGFGRGVAIQKAGDP